MNIKPILKIAVLLFFASSIQAQQNNDLSISLESNAQYYVDDDVTGDFEEEDHFRSNNYLKVDYVTGDFLFGIQLEGYAPQPLLNYSPNYDEEFNVATYFAKYSKEKFDITLGYFYEQFGSGLALRAWEDRQLGLNNAIRGAKISYRPSEKVTLTALYGNQRFGFDVSDGEIYGLDTNFDLSNENNSLQVGFSYVGRHQDINSANNDLNNTTHVFSGRLNYAKNSIYANLEGVVKTKDALVEDHVIFDDKLFFGNALLLELGYSKSGFGLNTSLRRVENMNFFSDREASGNTFNEQIINYLPGLTKQQDYSIANIYVYNPQTNLTFNPRQRAGEMGMQWDLFYKFKKDTSLGGKYGTKVAVNFSNWYGIDADYNNEFRRAEVSFLDLGDRYFTELSMEVRKKFSKRTSMIFTYINNYYNRFYIEEGIGEIRSNIFVTELTQKLANKRSMRFEAQHLWTKDDMQNWAAGTVEFNLNTNFSFFATDLYNYGNDDKDERNHFYNIGGSYAKNRSRFSVGYGRQRGGLLCVGGVCRIVSPATGLTFTINTTF